MQLNLVAFFYACGIVKIMEVKQLIETLEQEGII